MFRQKKYKVLFMATDFTNTAKIEYVADLEGKKSSKHGGQYEAKSSVDDNFGRTVWYVFWTVLNYPVFHACSHSLYYRGDESPEVLETAFKMELEDNIRETDKIGLNWRCVISHKDRVWTISLMHV